MNRMARATVAMGVIAAATGEALAQLPDPPGQLQADKPWLTWLIAAVLVVGAAVATVKSAKRTHLD